jgi:hypothetical protein
MKKNLPNVLLIAGTGRNSGKTMLACSLINKFSAFFRTTGIKISPHFHGGTESLKLIKRSEHFNLYEETSPFMAKDSSRMLKARAAKVLYAEVSDTYLPEAIEAMFGLIPSSSPVVCESPALIKFVHPGIYIVADNPEIIPKKPDIAETINLADFIFNLRLNQVTDIVNKIDFSGSSWITTNQKIT